MISSVVIAIEVFLLLLFPGGLIISLPGPRQRSCSSSPGEFIFLSCLLSFCVSSLIGVFLSYLGIFSVSAIALINAIICLFLLLAGHPRISYDFLRLCPRRLRDWALVMIFVLASILYFRPIPYVFGGWDPGVYVNTATHLARTGKLVIKDPVMTSLTVEDRARFSRVHSQGYPEKYPGFRYYEDDPGKLIPQFYHLYPVWLAVFYSWGGLKFLFLLNPFLGLGALAAIYFSVRRLWGWRTALFSLLPISLGLVEIWQARFPTSEMLSQFLFFGGLALFSRYLETSGRRCAVIAGIVFGCFFVSHISGVLLLLPLFLFFYVRWYLRFRSRDLWFVIPMLLGLFFSLLPHLIFGPRYALGSLRQAGFSSYILIGSAIVLLSLFLARMACRSARGRISRFCSRPCFRLFFALALCALIAFGIFIRPGLGNENPERTNLLELSWFLTPVGMGLAILAVLAMVIQERSASRWFFLLVLLTFSSVFLWRQMIHFNYIWAARRFAVITIPGGLILAAVFLRWLDKYRPGRLISPLLFGLVIIQMALVSRPVWDHREYEGALGFTAWLEGELSPSGPVLVSGAFVDKLPAMLHLLLDLDVLPLYRDDPDTVARGVEILFRLFGENGFIYYLSDSPPPELAGFSYELTRKIPFHSVLLERCWDHPPSRVENTAPDANFEVLVYRLFNRE